MSSIDPPILTNAPAITVTLALTFLSWEELLTQIRPVNRRWKEAVEHHTTMNGGCLLGEHFQHMRLDVPILLRRIQERKKSVVQQRIQQEQQHVNTATRRAQGATHLWMDELIQFYATKAAPQPNRVWTQTTLELLQMLTNKTASTTTTTINHGSNSSVASVAQCTCHGSLAAHIHSLSLAHLSLIPGFIVEPQLSPQQLFRHLPTFKNLVELDLTDRLMSNKHRNQLWRDRKNAAEEQQTQNGSPSTSKLNEDGGGFTYFDWRQLPHLVRLRLDRCSQLIPQPEDYSSQSSTTSASALQHLNPTVPLNRYQSWLTLSYLTGLEWLSLEEIGLTSEAWRELEMEQFRVNQLKSSSPQPHPIQPQALAPILFPHLIHFRIGGNGLSILFWDEFITPVWCHNLSLQTPSTTEPTSSITPIVEVVASTATPRPYILRSSLLSLDTSSLTRGLGSAYRMKLNISNSYSASFFQFLPRVAPNLKHLILGQTKPTFNVDMEANEVHIHPSTGVVMTPADMDDSLIHLGAHSALISVDLSYWMLDDEAFAILLDSEPEKVPLTTNPEANDVVGDIVADSITRPDLLNNTYFRQIFFAELPDLSSVRLMHPSPSGQVHATLSPHSSHALSDSVMSETPILKSPISRNLVHLDLSLTNITHVSLPLISRCTTLTSIHLNSTYITSAQAVSELIPNLSSLQILKCTRSRLLSQLPELDVNPQWEDLFILRESTHSNELNNIRLAVIEGRVHIRELVVDTHLFTDDCIRAMNGISFDSPSAGVSSSSSPIPSTLQDLTLYDHDLAHPPHHAILPFTHNYQYRDFGYSICNFTEEYLQRSIAREESLQTDEAVREELREKFEIDDDIVANGKEVRRKEAEAMDEAELQINGDAINAPSTTTTTSTNFLVPFTSLTSLTLQTESEITIPFLDSLNLLPALSSLTLKHVREWNSTHLLALTALPQLQLQLRTLSLSFCMDEGSDGRWQGALVSTAAVASISRLKCLEYLYLDGCDRVEDAGIMAFFQPNNDQQIESVIHSPSNDDHDDGHHTSSSSVVQSPSERPKKQMKLAHTDSSTPTPHSSSMTHFPSRIQWSLSHLCTLSLTCCTSLSPNFLQQLYQHAQIYSLQVLPTDPSLVLIHPVVGLNEPCSIQQAHVRMKRRY